MKGLVTVFGGSGFVGSQVVRALAKQGYRVRVAVRNVAHGYRLRMVGDPGQIEVVQANLRNADSVARALDGAETCINLVAVLFESGRQKFEGLHVAGARTVAQAARAAGVQRFIHVSAIGAAADSPSLYGRTKAAGEAAVREAYPAAVILRPSVVFGQGDRFFNFFATMAMISPALPLIGGGKTRFQPVFVGDVAAAVARVVADPSTDGATYELGGPGVYSFRELMELMLGQIRRRRLLISLPFGLAGLIGASGDLVAVTGITPFITSDQVKLLQRDNVAAAGAPGLADLGVKATALEGVIPSYLYRFMVGGQYADEIVSAAAVADAHALRQAA